MLYSIVLQEIKMIQDWLKPKTLKLSESFIKLAK